VGRRGNAAVAVVVLLAGVAACTPKKPKPDEPAHSLARAWSAGDFGAVAALTDAPDPTVVSTAFAQAIKDLGVSGSAVKVTRVEQSGDTATAAYTATLALPDVGEWSYDGQFGLRRIEKKWRVTWAPSLIHPQLQDGQRFGRTRSLPARAAVLDGAGKPLFGTQRVVTIGIHRARLKDPATAYRVLQRETGVDIARLKKRVAAATADAFVEVITLRDSEFRKVEPALRPIPGVPFRASTQLLTPSAEFARALLGRVGPATAEQLAKAGPLFRPGDLLGLGGIQGAYQTQLTGTPSVSIVVKTGDEVDATLREFPGSKPEPVHTTLDRRVQAAAEAALGSRATPAALVAVRPSTGEVLAVANRPSDLALNRAFEGRYPPGSTFKVVTTAALLADGLQPTEVVPCPPTKSVGGKSFRNFEGESGGRAAFATDFAHSCNTAFVSLAPRLTGDGLAATARDFGIGAEWKTGLPAYAGQVPPAKDATELAASMIGQGRVLASPLGMASVAAAVADGTWRSPVLVSAPAGQEQIEARLDPGVAATLRTLMRRVVTDGTGTRAAAPGGPVHGKTGTAEFGDRAPLKTHAWFVGFRGDVAVAVLLEGGPASLVGGRDAAPVAARFFSAL
jgi:cell division protein FtsI/penicillin-binding protein 2